jgi:hypothetical protein
MLWFCAVLSWVYGVWESIAMFRLKAAAFRRGRIVLASNRALPKPVAANWSDERIVTASGQFRFLSPTELVFCPRFHWFSFRVHTPFPIKGRICFGESYALVTGRVPLGSSLFFGAWFVAWSVPILFLFTGKASMRETLPVVTFGWAFALGLVAFSLFVERRRADTIVNEIESYLSGRAA